MSSLARRSQLTAGARISIAGDSTPTSSVWHYPQRNSVAGNPSLLLCAPGSCRPASACLG